MPSNKRPPQKPSDAPLRAVVWAAVSTKKQADEDLTSLPNQEKDGRRKAEREGWTLLDVLRVPGHSRRYLDIHALAEDARKQGITAFDRLLELLDQNAFDVLVVRDGDRFARTQALHAYITERIIDNGARIFSLADGWIDENNYRMWIAMAGYKAAGEVDAFLKKSKAGREARARRGYPNKAACISHQVVRDELGKAVRMELRPGLERFWSDFAELILQGETWRGMEALLWQRGHAHPDTGWRMSSAYLHRLAYHPNVWGVGATYWRGKEGPWVFGDAPLPDGVVAEYGVLPPVWEGDTAERLKAELRRRWDSIKGRASPKHTYRFRGLLRCAHCMRSLGRKEKHTRQDGSQLILYECQSRQGHVYEFIHDQTAKEQINDFLEGWMRIGRADIERLIPDSPHETRQAEMLARRTALQNDLDKLTRQIETLVRRQAEAPESVQVIYAGQIQALAQQREQTQDQLDQLVLVIEPDRVQAGRQAAYEELVRLGLDAFWKQEDRSINQTLHALMGSYAFVVRDHEIVDIALKPPVEQLRSPLPDEVDSLPYIPDSADK